jgi:hypothetical protein
MRLDRIGFALLLLEGIRLRVPLVGDRAPLFGERFGLLPLNPERLPLRDRPERIDLHRREIGVEVCLNLTHGRYLTKPQQVSPLNALRFSGLFRRNGGSSVRSTLCSEAFAFDAREQPQARTGALSAQLSGLVPSTQSLLGDAEHPSGFGDGQRFGNEEGVLVSMGLEWGLSNTPATAVPPHWTNGKMSAGGE